MPATIFTELDCQLACLPHADTKTPWSTCNYITSFHSQSRCNYSNISDARQARVPLVSLYTQTQYVWCKPGTGRQCYRYKALGCHQHNAIHWMCIKSLRTRSTACSKHLLTVPLTLKRGLYTPCLIICWLVVAILQPHLQMSCFDIGRMTTNLLRQLKYFTVCDHIYMCHFCMIRWKCLVTIKSVHHGWALSMWGFFEL